ncbi:ABC transporter ATP-binding protein/permease [Candidatus Gracilibacteria bacterium]|nr:ABC transporter ATP-binding protein/permease [Candidatus Gracilibacteria bacterium]
MDRKYTIFEILSRYFGIIKYRKGPYLRSVFRNIIFGMRVVIHVVFLQQIMGYLERGDEIGFTHILTVYIAFIFLYESLLFFLRNYGWSETIPDTFNDIYKIYLKKYVGLDNTSIEKIGTGKLIGIIQAGAKTWSESLASTFERGIEVIIGIIFSSYFIYQQGWLYVIVFLTMFIFAFIVSASVNNFQFRYRNMRYEYTNNVLHTVVKVIMSKQEILHANKLDGETDRIEKDCLKMRGVNKKMGPGRVLQNRIISFLINLGLFFVFFLFGKEVLHGNMELSELVGITGILIVIQGILINFITFYVDFTKSFVDIRKLWDFFDSTPEIQGYDTGSEFVHKKGEITLKNINYGYDENNPVFKKFNLTIPGEQITAIVGPSGGGKSTLVKLIAGYIKPQSGDVIVDEQNLGEVSLKSYYKDIGYLTQEPSVFDGTVYDNLTYALEALPQPLPSKEGSKTDIDSSPLIGGTSVPLDGRLGGGFEQHLHHIIKLAKCEFIYDFPEGLQTEIGEKGIRLSGGQRQRLAIAKIFLKDPKIIILDEPTSALDSFSEEQITQAMRNLFKGRTVIVIAHRLQTVKNADHIYVIENGQVVEEGTHTTLTRKKGIYKRMLDLQSGF